MTFTTKCPGTTQTWESWAEKLFEADQRTLGCCDECVIAGQFVDQQTTISYSKITTSLIDAIQVSTWVYFAWSGHLLAFDVTRRILVITLQYINVNTPSWRRIGCFYRHFYSWNHQTFYCGQFCVLDSGFDFCHHIIHLTSNFTNNVFLKGVHIQLWIISLCRFNCVAWRNTFVCCINLTSNLNTVIALCNKKSV